MTDDAPMHPATRPVFALSRSVKNAITPPIPKAQAWAAAYTSTDKPLLNLSQGVPGDPPHPLLLDALAKSSADPKAAGYGPILGEPELRRAVRREMGYVYRWEGWESEDQQDLGGVVIDDVGEEGTVVESSGNEPGVPPTWEEIAITSGCNQAFFNIILALCDRGDKVIIPVPWYFNMLMTFQVLGIEPLPLPLDPSTQFTPTVASARTILESPEGKGTKALILVTPNNPTGSTYPAPLLERFADLAREFGIALIVDETYRDFVLPSPAKPDQPGRPHTLFSRADWRSHVVSLASFSKSYKIPGHRLGAIVAGKEVLQAVTTVADCIQICAPRPPQLALAPLLPSLRPDLATTSSRLHARLALFSALVSAVHGWSVAASGGFFSYVRHPFFRPGSGPVPSEEVSEVMARRCGVVTLPGMFFMPEVGSGAWRTLEDSASPLVHDRWIRFAVANVSDEVVRRVPERLEMLNGIMQDEYGCEIRVD